MQKESSIKWFEIVIVVLAALTEGAKIYAKSRKK